jgi:hypothetical protein
VGLAVGVDRAADLRDPQLDAVVTEHGEHELELRAGKGALGFADHERIPVSGLVCGVVEKSARLGAS